MMMSDDDGEYCYEEEDVSRALDEVRYGDAVRAMEEGDEGAKTVVAFYKLSGRDGAEIDWSEAVALLEERTKDGDSEAAWMLGVCYEFGMGTEQDLKQAELLYCRSCEAGNDVGQFFASNGCNERGSRVMKVEGLCYCIRHFITKS